jgi:outer membrane immunogenic protein
MLAPWYDWTGFYAGGNGGFSWGRSATEYTGTGVGLPFATTQNMDGGLGGGQIGYNWQFNRNWLFGLEADIQGTGQGGTVPFPTVVVPPGGTISVIPGFTTTGSLSQNLPWFGTVRARLGVLPGDHWLLYATGGLAYGGIDSTFNVTSTTTTGTVTTGAGSANNIRAGWTVGGGVEWVISGPWTAKLEYLYMDLGTFANTFTGTGAYGTVTTSSHITDNIFRAGINYRFR